MQKFKFLFPILSFILLINIHEAKAMEQNPLKEFGLLNINNDASLGNQIDECCNLFSIFLYSKEIKSALGKIQKLPNSIILELTSQRPEIALEIVTFSILLIYLNFSDFKQLIIENEKLILETLKKFLRYNLVINPKTFKNVLECLIKNISSLGLANKIRLEIAKTNKWSPPLNEAILIIQEQLTYFFVIFSYLLREKALYQNIYNFLCYHYPQSKNDLVYFLDLLKNKAYYQTTLENTCKKLNLSSLIDSGIQQFFS